LPKGSHYFNPDDEVARIPHAKPHLTEAEANRQAGSSFNRGSCDRRASDTTLTGRSKDALLRGLRAPDDAAPHSVQKPTLPVLSVSVHRWWPAACGHQVSAQAIETTVQQQFWINSCDTLEANQLRDHVQSVTYDPRDESVLATFDSA